MLNLHDSGGKITLNNACAHMSSDSSRLVLDFFKFNIKVNKDFKLNLIKKNSIQSLRLNILIDEKSNLRRRLKVFDVSTIS